MPTTKTAQPVLPPSDQLKIEEFLDFANARPDGEKWELIEGIASLSPTPSDFHQIIVGNLLMALGNWKSAHDTTWIPLIGVGTHVPVSPRSLPAPDLMVKASAATGAHTSDEGLVLVEVLSPSNTKADRDWRLSVYRSVPNCSHYVTIAQRRVHITRYDRGANWRATEMRSIDDALDLPALGDVTIPVAEIYKWTPLAKS